MSARAMGRVMGGTELSSLPLAPTNRDRLLRAGFRTLRDVEGIQPLDLSRGAVHCRFSRWIFLGVYVVHCCALLFFAFGSFSRCSPLIFASWNFFSRCSALLVCRWIFLEVLSTVFFAVGYFLEMQQCTAVCHWIFLEVQYVVHCCLRSDTCRGCCFPRRMVLEVK